MIINNKRVNNQRVFHRIVLEDVLTTLLSRNDNSLELRKPREELRRFLSVDETTRTIDYRGRGPSKRSPSLFYLQSAFLRCRVAVGVFLRICILIVLHLCNSLYAINNI